MKYSNTPDRDETIKYLEDLEERDKITPFFVLSNNYVEQLKATLNYSPRLNIRSFKPKECPKPKEDIWQGTYIYVRESNGLNVVYNNNQELPNPIEHLLESMQTEYGDYGNEFGLSGTTYGSEVYFSTPDVTDEVYAINCTTSHTLLQTDFTLNGKSLTMEELSKGIKGRFIPDITGESTLPYRDYFSYRTGYNRSAYEMAYEPYNAYYTSYIGFYDPITNDIRVNNIPIAEYTDEHLTVKVIDNKAVIYGKDSFTRDKFITITSINPIRVNQYSSNSLSDDYPILADKLFPYHIEPSNNIKIRIIKPNNVNDIDKLLGVK